MPSLKKIDLDYSTYWSELLKSLGLSKHARSNVNFANIKQPKLNFCQKECNNKFSLIQALHYKVRAEICWKEYLLENISILYLANQQRT